MKLSVIIVSYNVKYYLEQCLIALRRALNGIEAEVYVVDNDSKDGSTQYLRERFPDVKYINNNENYGFSRANNIAIKQSDSQYVLLLNPDTIVGESTIMDAISFMDSHERAGGLGVHMLNTDGSSALESRRGFPTLSSAFYKFSGLCSKFPRSHKFGKYYMSYLPWDTPAKMEVISGAFFMLRRRALDAVGLLDEDFFMYGEDVDLSYRLVAGGFENWYLPAKILHYKGESTMRSCFRYVYVFHKAMLVFISKHHYGMNSFMRVPIKVVIYMKAAVRIASIYIHRLLRVLVSFGILRRKKAKKYIFIGSEGSVKACEKIARKRVLNAKFVVGDEASLPNGHLDMSLAGAGKCVIVYDIDAYGFDTILGLFSQSVYRNVRLGTFNPNTGLIITEKDVF